MVHIPYKGGAPSTMDLIAGQIQMQLGTLLLTGPHIKSGKLRVLAVTTPKRWPGTPELPTMQEAGVPGFAITQWYGMIAPAKTPPAIINKLQKEISRLLLQPDVKERSHSPAPTQSAARGRVRRNIKAEVAKYGKLVKQVGLKAE
jgi:tripartite-type tricarboxylate transporter receptor subunit TctC